MGESKFFFCDTFFRGGLKQIGCGVQFFFMSSKIFVGVGGQKKCINIKYIFIAKYLLGVRYFFCILRFHFFWRGSIFFTSIFCGPYFFPLHVQSASSATGKENNKNALPQAHTVLPDSLQKPPLSKEGERNGGSLKS